MSPSGLIKWARDGLLCISMGNMLELPHLRTSILQSLKIVFSLANSADPDEMLIGVFTVCKSTHLEVSSIQRVN